MSLFKNLLIGAAVVAGVNYITKKRPDGKSMVDDLKEKAPEWIDKAKEFGNAQREQLTGQKDQFNRNPSVTDNY